MQFKFSFLLFFIVVFCSANLRCANPSQKNKIVIDTSKGHAIQEGSSGFNVRIADKVWSYAHPDFQKAVHGLKPGWLRYFSGTMGDAFNSATGLYDKDYAMMFDHKNQYYKGYQFTQVKGPHRLMDLYELLGEVGGKLIVTINAFTETPQIAKELAQFCKNNNVEVETWQFCNEPYFYVPHRKRYWWNDGYDYALKMKPYADAIKEVDPDAKLALNCTWDGIWGFMKEIHKYQEEHGAYWNVFSKHSYAPHVGGREPFKKALRRANTKVIEATSAEAMQEIEKYTWEGVPLMITEFGVWNSPLNGIISAIYNAEYTLRQLAHPNAFYIGSHEISNKYKPVKNLNHVILDAYKSGKKIDTNKLLTGIEKDDEGKAIELIHEATNNSVYTCDVTFKNIVKVEGLKGEQVNAMYARAFKGINGFDYVVLTNRSKTEQGFEIEFDGKRIQGSLVHKYMFSETAQNKRIPLHEEEIDAKDIIVRPYSVNLFKWESDEKYAPTAPRIYKSRVTKTGVELTWWKRDIADGYKLFYGTDKNNLDKSLDVADKEVFTLPTAKLKQGKIYYFAVAAYNKQGDSPRSKAISRSFKVPETPLIFKTTKRDTTITIMWQSVPNADGYKIAVNDGASTQFYDVKNVFGYRIEGLKYNNPYTISVIAYNGLGDGKASKEQVITCKKHLPYPPRNISAKETKNGDVILQWEIQDTINPDVKYRLFRGKEPHNFTLLAEGIQGNSYLDKSVKHGDDFYYTVKSYNADGECNFYPNVATIIKRDNQINIDISEIVDKVEVYLVKVNFSNIKLDGDVRYGISVSDISYLTVEENVYQTEQTTRKSFEVEIPKSDLKPGRTYAIKAFVNTNGSPLFSLPPHKNIKIER